jgi:sugar O-acyltransferase (sialic acid O-acetyltransferase NeuD family)
MSSFSLIGYSGHAYVCIETAMACGLTISGYYDILENKMNPYNLFYFGQESGIKETEKVFIAIGDNGKRAQVHERLQTISCDINAINLVHPKASVSLSVILGSGILVSAGAVINAFADIEDFCIINTAAIIEHECIIQSFSHIAPGAVLTGNVSIGKNVFVGANSIVKQGLSICDYVTIGMGAVVTKNITEPGVYIGAPAVRVR